MGEKVIIVEDEISLQETLSYNLKKQGYDVQVVGDGLKALETIRSWHPDLIILDVMLPGMDGFEITRTIRQEISTPVLMLTAKDEEIDRVVGLEIGADDYITKPFSMRELMARVKAMLRQIRLIRQDALKGSVQEEKQTLIFDNLTIDISRHELRLVDKVLQSKPKEYELFMFLAQHKGQALSREFILDHVWGWDYVGDSRTVDVHVRWLREKIEVDPSNPQRIVTVRGSGYRFEG